MIMRVWPEPPVKIHLRLGDEMMKVIDFLEALFPDNLLMKDKYTFSFEGRCTMDEYPLMEARFKKLVREASKQI